VTSVLGTTEIMQIITCSLQGYSLSKVPD
jgi:hypothetical protein